MNRNGMLVNSSGTLIGDDMRKMLSLLCLIAFAAAAVLLLSELQAFAAGTGGGSGGMPWEEGLGKIRDSIKGPVAMAISLIAIVASGVMLVFGGDMQGFMRTAAYLALVIGIIVAAQNLLEKMYAGSSATIPFC